MLHTQCCEFGSASNHVLGTVERLGDQTGCGRLLYQHLPAQDLHLQAISEDSLQIGVASRHCGIVERTIWIQELAQVRLVFDVPSCTIRPRQQHEQEVRVRQRTLHDIVYMAEAFFQELVVALPEVVLRV